MATPPSHDHAKGVKQPPKSGKTLAKPKGAVKVKEIRKPTKGC